MSAQESVAVPISRATPRSRARKPATMPPASAAPVSIAPDPPLLLTRPITPAELGAVASAETLPAPRAEPQRHRRVAAVRAVLLGAGLTALLGTSTALVVVAVARF